MEEEQEQFDKLIAEVIAQHEEEKSDIVQQLDDILKDRA